MEIDNEYLLWAGTALLLAVLCAVAIVTVIVVGRRKRGRHD